MRPGKTVARYAEPCENALKSLDDFLPEKLNLISKRGLPGSYRASLPGISGQPSASWSLHFDPAHQRLIDDRSELDHKLPAGIGVRGELPDDGLVLGPGGREDVERTQHLRAVDSHVERPRTRRGEEGFGKMQPRRVAGARRKPGNRVGEVPNAGCLVYGHGRGISYAGQIDSIRVADGAAAYELHVGNKRTHRRTAGIDLHTSGCHGLRGGAGLVRRPGCASRIGRFQQVEERG